VDDGGEHFFSANVRGKRVNRKGAEAQSLGKEFQWHSAFYLSTVWAAACGFCILQKGNIVPEISSFLTKMQTMEKTTCVRASRPRKKFLNSGG
jgi:hypothetical protein